MTGGASKEELSRRFSWFASEVFAPHSPLYGRLAAGVAGDPELLALAGGATSGPEPNLLLSAAHLLLLGGVEHPAAAFYPNLSGGPPKSGDPYPAFRSLCLEHADEITRIITSRRVQTNEVRRCALLLPALGIVARRTGRPLALVEVGTSAGLNLLFDRYAYDYGEGSRLGDPRSPVRISCEAAGGTRPPLPERLPAVASRIGLDLNPLDVRDQESARWLLALIWPEEYADRAPRLEAAIALARRDPPTLLRGDALDLLPEVLDGVPESAAACIFHTFTVNQFSVEAREQLAGILREHAVERDLHRISIEWLESEDAPLLRLFAFDGDSETGTLLARCDGHGGWIEWLAANGS